MKRIAFALTLLLTVATPALAGQNPADLAKASGCMNCHAVSAKVIGPAFADVGKKYKNTADASNYLTNKILKGSSGVWGAVPMPASSHVNPTDARTLANWILSL